MISWYLSVVSSLVRKFNVLNSITSPSLHYDKYTEMPNDDKYSEMWAGTFFSVMLYQSANEHNLAFQDPTPHPLAFQIRKNFVFQDSMPL